MFMQECGVEREIDEREMNTTYSEVTARISHFMCTKLARTSPGFKLTRIYKYRVLVSGNKSSRFDSNTLY
jgi:hypothetical protein